jgi:hypothetical protein
VVVEEVIPLKVQQVVGEEQEVQVEMEVLVLANHMIVRGMVEMEIHSKIILDSLILQLI